MGGRCIEEISSKKYRSSLREYVGLGGKVALVRNVHGVFIGAEENIPYITLHYRGYIQWIRYWDAIIN